ncbi:MAG: hypothetical protein RL199_1223 [Pseudomonadota bacterium]|jgi:hypothetical protein
MNRLVAGLMLLTCLLAAPAARAQSFPVTLTQSKFASLSRGDCLLDPQETANFAFTWTYPTVVTGETESVFVSRTSSCSDTTTGTPPDALLLRSEADRTAVTGTFPGTGSTEVLSARKLFDFVADNCGGDAGIETTVYLCVNIEVPASGVAQPQSLHGSVAIKLDSKPPPTPTAVSVETLDGGLVANWSMPTDLDGAGRYFVHVVAPDGTDKGAGIAGSATGSASITGLTNGTAYTVTVTSFDAAGTARERNNESAASEPVTATPQAVQDFFARYKAAGGGESGGCASTRGSLWAVAALALLVTRRRRRLDAFCVALVVSGFAATASAENADEPAWQHSPRHFATALRAGSWGPRVDREAALSGATPFADIFGRSSPKLWRLQLDLDVFDALGRLSVGVDTGFWQALGKGRSLTDDAKTKDTITFTVVPVTPMLTYRADFLWELWRIPVVPFGKAGYGLAHWSTDKAGSTSKVGDANGAGWAKGFEWGAGLQLVLDALESDQAASIDQDYGINSTRLFVEYDEMKWKGKGGLRLDGASWTGGVMIAF